MSASRHRPGWSADERRDLAHVAAVVREWLDACDSPLYAHLAREIAGDPDMLALLAREAERVIAEAGLPAGSPVHLVDVGA
ncbi:MAG: hypothetical protein DIU73_006295, partial [Actinomycetes bacterium]